jgi:hypothetical protein
MKVSSSAHKSAFVLHFPVVRAASDARIASSCLPASAGRRDSMASSAASPFPTSVARHNSTTFSSEAQQGSASSSSTLHRA